MLAEIATVSFFSAKVETLASREMNVEINTDKIKVEGDDLRCVDRFLLFIISSPFWGLGFGVTQFTSRQGRELFSFWACSLESGG